MKLLDWLKSRWYIFLLTDTPEWRCREVYYDEHGNWLGDPQHYKTKDLNKAITYIGFLKGE